MWLRRRGGRLFLCLMPADRRSRRRPLQKDLQRSDTRIAQPFLVLLGLNILGLICAIPRYFHFYTVSSGSSLLDMILNIPANMYDGTHPGTIVMNVVWTVFNIIVLGVATAVAWESQQRRTTVRVSMAVPAGVLLPNGLAVQGVTSDMSSGGVMMQVEEDIALQPGDPVRLVFPVLDGDATLPATVIGLDGRTLRAHFDPLTIQEEEALTMVLYSRADTWLGWGEAREVDKPLLSLWRILQLSGHGLSKTFRGMMTPRNKTPKGKLATSVVPLILFCLLLPGLMPGARAQVRAVPAGTPPVAVNSNGTVLTTGVPPTAGGVTNDGGTPARAVAPGTFDNIFTLADVGVPDTIVLRGVDAYHSVYFSVPQTQVVKTATLKLRYHFSPGLLPAVEPLEGELERHAVRDASLL